MSEVRIDAEPRTEFGKGGARRTRRAGKIPAVLYGHGTEPRHLSLPARELGHALKAGANMLLTLQLDGASELALPKAIQRDPIRGDYEHVDLLLVRRGEKVTVEVRVTLTGEANREGLVDQQLITLTVEAEATHIPDRLRGRRSRAAGRRQRHAGDVPLPSGTTLIGDPDAGRGRGAAPRRAPSSSRPSSPVPRPRPGSSATSTPRPPRRRPRRPTAAPAATEE